MAESSLNEPVEFKSPKRVVVKFLHRSRELKSAKYRKVKKDLERTRSEMKRLQKELDVQKTVNGELSARCRNLECAQYRQAQEATITLPTDPPLGQHGYGARMVLLCLNLIKAVGFRASEKTLNIVFDWMNLKQEVPHFSTIRGWMQREGIGELEKPPEFADDWCWFSDHSNQIGQEKILVVLGIRASKLPLPGTALKHEDMTVLAVQPGKSWKQENVAAVYTKLAEQYGAPRALLSDGAVELIDSAECFKAFREDIITLQDFKHKAANFLESMVGKTERFKEFQSQIGTTRNAIQQTELAHLTPPTFKTKARFMNIGPMLAWATVILWLLEHPEAKSHEWMTSDKLTDKLGWVKSFASELVLWDECQQVINRGLKFINTQGVFVGAAAQIRQAMGVDLQHTVSQQLADRLAAFVREAEGKLKAGERLPLSTEILESSFGLYKQLEGQHSKGGFTSLIVTFAALLNKPTIATIKENFSKVSNKDVKEWLKKHLGTTVTSKRRSTYYEMKKATGRCRPTKAERAKKTTVTT